MTRKPIVYLDWNILGKLWMPASQPEKNKTHFAQLEQMVEAGKLVLPYSNAHIRDLSRGVSKRPEYAQPHTDQIARATNNLCITQYWGEQEVRWQYRNAAEFLESTIADKSFATGSYADLFSNPDIDETGLMSSFHAAHVNTLRLLRLPEKFREYYKADPIFSLMFPKTKVESTMLSLYEDIYDFMRVIMSDHALYKQFKTFLANAKARSMEVRKVGKAVGERFETEPAHLEWDEMWEQIAPMTEVSKNAKYSKLVDLFTRTDLKGYAPDEKFSNLIDDALHTFYGAHCDYFVTLDERCLMKAQKVYAELDIPSVALFLPKFLASLSVVYLK